MADAPIFYSEEQLFEFAIAFLEKRYPGKATHPRSYLGNQARTFAQQVGAIQAAQKQAWLDGVPGYQVDYDGIIRSRCSTIRLDDWAFFFGLPSNRGAGVFGRNGAFPASGGGGTIIGPPATLIPAGDQLTDPSGSIAIELADTVTIGGGGTVQGVFNAITPGAAGNLAIGTKIRWLAPRLGVTATVTLGTALSGGYDEEGDYDLVARLIRRMQAPPRAGSAADWRAWAEAALDANGKSLGISRAYVYPFRNGIGSVDVVITVSGNGSTRDPGSIKAAAAQVYLDGLRIATDTVRVVRPRFPAGFEIKARARIRAAPGYRPDWDDGGTGITLVSGAGTASVVISGVNTALKAAADLNLRPRIQVGVTGFQVPRQRQVLTYQADTPIVGQSTLLLDSALEAGAFSHATAYAGSSAVEPVATAMLAEMNGKGPSKQSGYQDETFDSWADVVDVGGLARAALDVVDGNGKRIVTLSPNVGQVGAGPGSGITMAQGGGAFSALDRLTFDNVPGLGPELPNPILVLVTA